MGPLGVVYFAWLWPTERADEGKSKGLLAFQVVFWGAITALGCQNYGSLPLLSFGLMARILNEVFPSSLDLEVRQRPLTLCIPVVPWFIEVMSWLAVGRGCVCRRHGTDISWSWKVRPGPYFAKIWCLVPCRLSLKSSLVFSPFQPCRCVPYTPLVSPPPPFAIPLAQKA